MTWIVLLLMCAALQMPQGPWLSAPPQSPALHPIRVRKQPERRYALVVSHGQRHDNGRDGNLHHGLERARLTLTECDLQHCRRTDHSETFQSLWQIEASCRLNPSYGLSIQVTSGKYVTAGGQQEPEDFLSPTPGLDLEVALHTVAIVGSLEPLPGVHVGLGPVLHLAHVTAVGLVDASEVYSHDESVSSLGVLLNAKLRMPARNRFFIQLSLTDHIVDALQIGPYTIPEAPDPNFDEFPPSRLPMSYTAVAVGLGVNL